MPPTVVKQLQRQLVESEEITNATLDELENERRDKKKCLNDYHKLMFINQRLQGEMEALTNQLEETRAALEDSRSHILSMQPYAKDITPEEIGRVGMVSFSRLCGIIDVCSRISTTSSRRSPIG